MDAVAEAFDEVVDKKLLIRRFNITAENVLLKEDIDDVLNAENKNKVEQMNIFTNYELEEQMEKKEEANLQKELEIQRVMLMVKEKFEKNAILRGMNLQESATAKDRNAQIGGHKA